MTGATPLGARRVVLRGRDGIALAADVAGPETGRPVVLLHGGGQTRGSWKTGFAALAAAGYRAIAVDARGHGESGWAPDGDYTLAAQVGDLRAILADLPAEPVLIGASLGGSTALALLGEPDPPAVRALVLVDVAPKVDRAGVERIGAFMRAHLDGFATIEEAADAVAAYNPLRPRPRDLSGLRRNLRAADGRLFWHWDPAFVGARGINGSIDGERMRRIAASLTVPTLLVRGARSEVVGVDEVEDFRRLMPGSTYVDVAGAGHMIVGDRNDAFNAAILGFLATLDRAADTGR